MFLAFFFTFCRAVIGGVFMFSLLGKVGNIAAFQTTIANFHLLPKSLTKGVAILFLLSEFMVVFCMVIGGKLLSFGFSLAFFLLVIFSIAMVMVLTRGIQTPCNCFGTSSKTISYYDVVRNVGFVVCAVGGWIVLALNTMSTTLSLPQSGLIGFVAVAFVMLWTHLAEIVELFRLT